MHNNIISGIIPITVNIRISIQLERFASCSLRDALAKFGSIIRQHEIAKNDIVDVDTKSIDNANKAMTALNTQNHQYSERAARPEKVAYLEKHVEIDSVKDIGGGRSFDAFTFSSIKQKIYALKRREFIRLMSDSYTLSSI